MPLTITTVTDEAGFRHLAPEWNALLRASRADGIFLTWEYLATWWEFYGHGRRLHLLVARDKAGTLAGIAPLMIGPGSSAARRRIRHLSFIGAQSDSLSEFQDFIIAPGREDEVTRVFCDAILRGDRRPWDVLLLPMMPETSPVLPILLDALRARGGRPRIANTHVAPYADLPATWDGFLAGKSANFRQQSRRRLRKLSGLDDVSLRRPGSELELDHAMDEVIRLNHERWGDAGAAFQTAAFTGFHRKLASVFYEKGWLSLRLLDIGGETAAARYDFVYGGVLWNFQGGWSGQFAHLSLGNLAIALSIRECIEDGLHRYDFLAGDSPYKQSWATGRRTLVDVEMINPESVPARAFECLRTVRRAFASC